MRGIGEGEGDGDGGADDGDPQKPQEQWIGQLGSVCQTHFL